MEALLPWNGAWDGTRGEERGAKLWCGLDVASVGSVGGGVRVGGISEEEALLRQVGLVLVHDRQEEGRRDATAAAATTTTAATANDANAVASWEG